MPEFKDLKSKTGLAQVNEFLKTRSYLDGYQASKQDVEVFDGLGAFQASADFPYLTRWHNHIKSFSADERKSWSGAGCSKNVASAKKEEDEEDDDVDLFGDDDEDDAEKERLKEERVKAYAEKKSKKPALVAKSSVILDVKPWDDETDMAVTEKLVRAIEMDGLVWGASKLVPLAYGIKKLQIMCVVEDDKVSIDELQEKITEFEDQVQSVDIAAFNKI